MADGALLVISDPAGWSRPEPGVGRLPTLSEQYRALARWSARLGRAVHPDPLVLETADRSAAPEIVVASATDPAVTALLLISTDCVSGPHGVDLDAVARLWTQVEMVGFLIEDLLVSNESEFRVLLQMLHVVGAVRSRDMDPARAALVAELGASMSGGASR